ncbi:DUF4142 domain-containing protein [Deinococcus detaillensis]|uniref:DUF4142 domain-containing protein n=2 Tax=Deinococcus detaillensis TaxID=2592048 RepID=A0A553UWT5_9DEIO|nr:DUF4142 domain-containing protein [Deinococcus detaillensis]
MGLYVGTSAKLFHLIFRLSFHRVGMKKILILSVLIATVTSAQAASMLSHTDTNFLNKAVMGNMFEIQASQLALTMAKAPADQTFAKQMISDHTKLGSDVQAAVAKVDASMMLPSSVSKAQQRMLNKLKKSGKNFDKLYKADMLSSHAKTITLFANYTASRHANPTIKAAAMNALPTIKTHHDEAKTLPKM